MGLTLMGILSSEGQGCCVGMSALNATRYATICAFFVVEVIRTADVLRLLPPRIWEGNDAFELETSESTNGFFSPFKFLGPG